MPVKNPYIAGNPVGKTSSFVDRHEILTEVLNILGSPKKNAVVLYGQRRIGKTSVLQRLEAQLSEQDAYYPVFF